MFLSAQTTIILLHLQHFSTNILLCWSHHLEIMHKLIVPLFLPYTLNKHKQYVKCCVSLLITALWSFSKLFVISGKKNGSGGQERRSMERLREVYFPLLAIFRLDSGQGWNSVYWTPLWWRSEGGHFLYTTLHLANGHYKYIDTQRHISGKHKSARTVNDE